MEIKQIEYNSKEYINSVNLRNKILRIPLGLFLDINKLEKEKSDIHIAAFEKNKIIGILILTPIDTAIVKMRQVAIDTGLQNKGIGSMLVEFSEKIAWDLKFSKIILDARSSAINFYLKMGYKILSDEYLDEHIKIPHYKMEKLLTL